MAFFIFFIVGVECYKTKISMYLGTLKRRDGQHINVILDFPLIVLYDLLSCIISITKEIIFNLSFEV